MVEGMKKRLRSSLFPPCAPCLRGSLLLLALAMSGCGEGKPDTVPATGEVFYKSAPVEGAEVTFTPDGGGALAMGVTDAAGKFTLRTFADGDGAITGSHRVTVVKNVAQPAKPDNPYPITKNMLPAKYARPDSSRYQFEVQGPRQSFSPGPC